MRAARWWRWRSRRGSREKRAARGSGARRVARRDGGPARAGRALWGAQTISGREKTRSQIAERSVVMAGWVVERVKSCRLRRRLAEAEEATGSAKPTSAKAEPHSPTAGPWSSEARRQTIASCLFTVNPLARIHGPPRLRRCTSLSSRPCNQRRPHATQHESGPRRPVCPCAGLP